MAALVGADRDGLRIFLQCGGNDILHGTVVPQVYDLGATVLEDPPHDVDGGVMPIEQAGRSDEADMLDIDVTLWAGGRGL